MKRESDFSNAVRGKFHRAEMEARAAGSSGSQILARLSARAESKGTLNALANELLKKDIELIETAR
jgi:hypothetical protein